MVFLLVMSLLSRKSPLQVMINSSVFTLYGSVMMCILFDFIFNLLQKKIKYIYFESFITHEVPIFIIEVRQVIGIINYKIIEWESVNSTSL